MPTGVHVFADGCVCAFVYVERVCVHVCVCACVFTFIRESISLLECAGVCLLNQ